MKPYFVIFTLFFTALPAHAGFFSSVLGGVTANAITGSGGSVVSDSKLKLINAYIWDMHINGTYEDGYEYYLPYLDDSSSVSYLDTLAFAYSDNGDRDKGVELYETRILPLLRFESDEVKSALEANYKKISGATEVNYLKALTRAVEWQQENKDVDKNGSWSITEWLIVIILLISLFYNYRLLSVTRK
ncbi:hypothetical protein [Nitrincola sp. MINF-07-Sa-05]|uniref:hypothetical protein n=1 Tax=Nitrincola salilacus TaxID=3400273 RepID=UPI003918455E